MVVTATFPSGRMVSRSTASGAATLVCSMVPRSTTGALTRPVGWPRRSVARSMRSDSG
jgi:hypothetical protein